MDLQLHNKLALITASFGGIGLAIAQTLAAEGARVIIPGRPRAFSTSPSTSRGDITIWVVPSL